MKSSTMQQMAPSNDTSLDDVREMLSFLGQKSNPARQNEFLLLGQLEESILELYEKGFSFQDISEFLSRCKIQLNSQTLEQHFRQIYLKRLKQCEQLISENSRPEWNVALDRSAKIERGLKQALDDRQGLVLHYQPQVDMNTGIVVGAEALVRWEFNGNIVHPAEFIPVAEGSGLIVPIGEWVLREACKEAKRWETMGLGGKNGLKMGVNLSVKQLSNSLPDMIHGVLCDVGLPTKLLGLEITESFLVGGNSLDILHSLQDSGIRLSIDDFGTGYSCLAQLKELPLDTIKIDRAFVKDLGREGNSSAVLEAIVDMAKKLNMKMLAEGVESRDQAEALLELGCSVCQGYLYSKPLSGNDFVKYVNN